MQGRLCGTEQDTLEGYLRQEDRFGERVLVAEKHVVDLRLILRITILTENTEPYEYKWINQVIKIRPFPSSKIEHERKAKSVTLLTDLHPNGLLPQLWEFT
jgi:hypothetical protein